MLTQGCVEQEISVALLPGPAELCTSHCAVLLAWGSCGGARSQGERHAMPTRIIPSAVGRDSSHVPGGALEEHTSAASPEEREQSSSCLNRIEGRRASRLLSGEEGDHHRHPQGMVRVRGAAAAVLPSCTSSGVGHYDLR